VDAPKKQYCVWVKEDENGDGGYFQDYDSIDDAAEDTSNTDHENGVEIFEAIYKSIGKYKRETRTIKVPKRSKK